MNCSVEENHDRYQAKVGDNQDYIEHLVSVVFYGIVMTMVELPQCTTEYSRKAQKNPEELENQPHEQNRTNETIIEP